jgi:hypothetical protein
MFLRPAVQAHHYPLPGLAQVSPAPIALLDEQTKRILIVIGVILLIWLAYTMMKKSAKPTAVTRNAAAKRLTTPELAKNLYARLEKRPGTNPATLRSLQSYASKR